MTVWYDPKSKGHRYDFQFQKRRYVSPRGYETRREGLDAEAERRRVLRRQAAGLETGTPADSPAFQDWAEVHLADLERRGKSTEAAVHVVRVVLRFFGKAPDRPLRPHEAGPYRDLRLIDPIVDPAILEDFEAWMRKRGVRPSTRNRYRSAVSQLYATAMRPRYRLITGVKENPMLGVERDVERGRTLALTREQLQAILGQASRHLWLAIQIAAMAPMLRLGNILALRWDRHVSADLRRITVDDHKTADRLGLPLVTPVSDQLRGVLEAAKAAQKKDARWVITYRGRRLKTIDGALKAACTAAGVPYGQRVGGVTFHTIRHSAATSMAVLRLPPDQRRRVIGHTTMAMTARYEHLAAAHIAPEVQQLSDHLGLVGPVVELPRKRAVRKATPGASSAERDRTARPKR